MPPTPEFADLFGDAIRHRGADYFRKGRVRIDSASAERIVATVRGSRPYLVELEREGREIQASCACPYDDEDFCKHIWAVLLAAQDKSLLQGKDLELISAFEDFGEDFGEDFDEEEDEDWELKEIFLQRRPVQNAPTPRPAKPPKAASWRTQIARLRDDAPAYSPAHDASRSSRQLLYVIDVANTSRDGGLYVEILCRERKKNGDWGKPRQRYLQYGWQQQLTDADDRHILALLGGATPVHSQAYVGSYYGAGYGSVANRYRLIDPQARILLPMICRTGRCHLRVPGRAEDNPEEYGPPLLWQDGEPWQLRLEVGAQTEHYELTGALWRNEERMPLIAATLAPAAGVLVVGNSVAPYEHQGAAKWIDLLREHGSVRVPAAQGEEFLKELQRQSQLPPLDLPQELRYEEVVLEPRPRLVVKPNSRNKDQLHGELSFDYDGRTVVHGQPGRGLVLAAERRILLRSAGAESIAEQRLRALGWRWGVLRYSSGTPKLELAARQLPAVVRELTAEGWHVEADGKLYRTSGQFDMRVSSGVDWFELHGEMQFGNVAARLPELLAAMRKGEPTVRLTDGSFGVLPQEWLKQYGLLAGMGEAHDDHVRFKRSQAGLLDALLATRPEARCDELFAQVRDQLRNFLGIQAQAVPVGFKGELRPYQHEALGWFHFLRQFGFGGCLADDMGLGKTVQVLALLEARRELREQAHRPTVPGAAIGASLVVVPRSLIFNWKQEAARFAPGLRVLDHTGNQRLGGSGHFADYDLVLTTYGTLRNDAADFKDVKFDYVILDEAQAIKNASSVSAKAVRLLQSEHRLALSGTPIENHLGELWSLFEFLNPGMLGAAAVFQMSQGVLRNPDEDTRRLLAQVLRPFVLRRTKEQVARELPSKIEQTIYCDLDTRQRRLYDQLRDHYRESLLERVDKGGIQRAKIQILEALLRLRQAAIHPGLLDKARLAESSAKLDVLLPSVMEATAEGHKTLVFSQFTGVLAILRDRLDREGIVYEYLDGKTRDRQARVERFQTDPQCKLFLISLKAGGVGLNLTAAQYVFLLDPWWNPAVEAQAIDRAHRIGQTRQVFAYRLIARDTVEEKVLALQDTKRDLADAIVGASEGLMRQLDREDLELLLS